MESRYSRSEQRLENSDSSVEVLTTGVKPGWSCEFDMEFVVAELLLENC